MYTNTFLFLIIETCAAGDVQNIIMVNMVWSVDCYDTCILFLYDTCIMFSSPMWKSPNSSQICPIFKYENLVHHRYV